jgi:hypothetical protein
MSIRVVSRKSSIRMIIHITFWFNKLLFIVISLYVDYFIEVNC